MWSAERKIWYVTHLKDGDNTCGCHVLLNTFQNYFQSYNLIIFFSHQWAGLIKYEYTQGEKKIHTLIDQQKRL